jgi:tetratricopeptide (TPR) repeat protein
MSKKKKTHRPGGRSINYKHLAVIIALSAIVFANVLPGNFVWDDEIQIVKNWRIRDLANLPSAFTTSFWSFLGNEAENQTNFYRPVQTVTYMLAYAAGGLSPTPYHAFSLIYHTAASVFVYLIALELMFTPGVALAIAGLFAVHPVHTEAVAWIAGIPDVACGAFYFGALWCFLRHLRGARPSWLFASCALFFAALLSKEMAVTLPFVLLLVMLWALIERQTVGAVYDRPRFSLVTIAPLFAVLALYLTLRIFALGLLATSQLQVQATWLDWISLGVRALGDYIHYALIPYPLNAFHLIPLKLEYRLLSTSIALAAVIVIAALLWYFRDRIPQGLLWFSCFVLMLVPVFYFKGMSNTFFAERYLYIPSFAMIMLFVTTALTLKIPRLNWIAGLIAAVFALTAVYRNPTWRTSEKLYETTLAVQPEVAHMRINLADIHLKRNEDEAARNLLASAEQYMQSDTYVRYPYELYRAYIGLGAIEARAGRYTEAREHFKKAIEVNPNGDWGYLYLGGVFMEADRDYTQAVTNFQKAIQLGPLNEVARDYMGIAMLNQKKNAEAIQYFEEALKINPNYEDARQHLNIARR